MEVGGPGQAPLLKEGAISEGSGSFGTRTIRVWQSYRACRDEIERPEGRCLWARAGRVVGFGGQGTWGHEEGWKREGMAAHSVCPPTCSQMTKVPHTGFSKVCISFPS